MASVKRGEVVWVDLDGAIGAEKQNGADTDGRTCLIIQNDKANDVLETTIVVPLTDAEGKRSPVLVPCAGGKPGSGVVKDSVIDCGQVRTIDQSRVKRKFGQLDKDKMSEVCSDLGRSFGCE